MNLSHLTSYGPHLTTILFKKTSNTSYNILKQTWIKELLTSWNKAKHNGLMLSCQSVLNRQRIEGNLVLTPLPKRSKTMEVFAFPGKTLSLCLLDTHAVIDIMPVALALVPGWTAFMGVFWMQDITRVCFYTILIDTQWENEVLTCSMKLFE